MLGAGSRSTGDAVSYTDGAGVCSPVISSVKRDCLRGSCGRFICDRKGELANEVEGEGVGGTAAASGMARGVVGSPESAMMLGWVRGNDAAVGVFSLDVEARRRGPGRGTSEVPSLGLTTGCRQPLKPFDQMPLV